MTTYIGPKLTMPSRSVYDRRFRYVNAAHTDVRRTWRKASLFLALQKKEVAHAPV
jgi:hypothetical protein